MHHCTTNTHLVRQAGEPVGIEAQPHERTAAADAPGQAGERVEVKGEVADLHG
jgi:hypothetical protein